MGNTTSVLPFNDDATGDFTLHVRTGDRNGAGTDANVWIVLHDHEGSASEQTRLNHAFHNDHERATTSSYQLNVDEKFGRLSKVELWRDSFGLSDDWFVDRIDAVDNRNGLTHTFPVLRWIWPETHFFLREYDCSLPQDDHHPDQRINELHGKRKIYRYCMHVDCGPVQCEVLPRDETFSNEYQWDIVKHKGYFILDTKLIKCTSEKWTSLENLKCIYKYHLGEPNCLGHWKEDYWFGLQRVQGINPVLISLCNKIPDNFGVESHMVEPFLEGLTLDEAVAARRIFLIDLKMLEGVVCKNNRTVCAPLALFFLDEDKNLMPIAIQLFQEKGPDNPVFLPSDPPYTWLVAKMYYNNADCTYHQSCTHLGFTHLLMEGMVVCTHRNLSPSHPIFKLLAPHFLFLLAINSRGIVKLVSPGGWVDKTMTVGREGMFEVIRRGMSKWRLDVEGTVLNDLKARGVDDPNVLPHYPYREDAIPLFDAIRNYTSKVVSHYYDSPEKVIKDHELQHWRQELTKDREACGVGLHGVPGQGNRFTTVEQVIDTVTSFISICSLGHAAANFPQYDEYGFPPNYPAILCGEKPHDKKPRTEKDILAQLPDKQTTLDIMVITKILSSRGTKSLGDFEVQYMYSLAGIQAAKEFREELDSISRRIKERNRNMRHPYPWLDPEIVPNAISI